MPSGSSSVETAAGSVSLSDSVLKVAVIGLLGIMVFALVRITGLASSAAGAGADAAGTVYDDVGGAAGSVWQGGSNIADGAGDVWSDGLDWTLGGTADNIDSAVGAGGDVIDGAANGVQSILP